MFKSREHSGGRLEINCHAHPEGQFSLLEEGVVQVVVEGLGQYFASKAQGVWLAPGVRHYAVYGGKTKVASVYFLPEFLESELLKNSFVVDANPLVLSLMKQCLALQEAGKGTEDPELQAAQFLLLRQLSRLRNHGNFLPIPKTDSLKNLVNRLISNPNLCGQSITELTKEMRISERHFRRVFLAETGISFGVWLKTLRLMVARELLAEGISVTEIALELGFEGTSAFVRFFKTELGVTPAKFYKAMPGKISDKSFRLKQRYPAYAPFLHLIAYCLINPIC